jgi:ATP-binding cassette subfamily B protein
MTRSAAPAASVTDSYTLSTAAHQAPQIGVISGIRKLLPVMEGERSIVLQALIAVIVTSTSGLIGPMIIGRTVDVYIRNKDFQGVLHSALILFFVYLCGLFSSYFQTQRMGAMGRRVLFNLRNALFLKLQALPVAFFNSNKTGDLISRINSDTDKLNQFFSQALVQFAGNLFMMTGAGIFLISLNPRLGAVALLPALGVLIVTQLISPWVRRKNTKNLQSVGGMSAEIQESLNNFKVIVAFNRTDYFRSKFNEANEQNFTSAVDAGLASNIFMPIYGLSQNFAQIVVIALGIYWLGTSGVSVGLLIGFLLYVNSFYMPLRQLAAMWAQLQLALAAVDRISEVLALEPNMPVIAAPAAATAVSSGLLKFENVSFGYREGQNILKDANFVLQRGRTYALVGPTGGGKTTTASLMARLYDPSSGAVLLDGRDIRSFSPEERTTRIGFILQEPFLFTGTVRDNIAYGNPKYRDLPSAELVEVLRKNNLAELLVRFEQGLDTKVTSSGDSVSLGQKQLIAFMRAALRNPELLILDEATANIDTITEQLLQEILDKLPASTTKVIIAHRLNTIANADEIFFVNAGSIVPAGSMEHAMDMLLHGKRES